MEPEGLLPCSQEPATGPYFEPAESSPHLLTLFLRSIPVLSTHLRRSLPTGLFPPSFVSNILYAFIFPMRTTCLAHLVLPDFITLALQPSLGHGLFHKIQLNFLEASQNFF